MKIAILEPDIEELNQTLETLSSLGHLCFATQSDEGLHRMIDEVSVDLVLVDWTRPDAIRYETLRRLVQRGAVVPVMLCVWQHTSLDIIESGLMFSGCITAAKNWHDTRFEHVKEQHDRGYPIPLRGCYRHVRQAQYSIESVSGTRHI